MTERIHGTSNSDDWICICGKDPSDYGFDTCDKAGKVIEPVVGGIWDGKLYVCNECGRIIDQDTCEVVVRSNVAA